jgi:hypothetical protein
MIHDAICIRGSRSDQLSQKECLDSSSSNFCQEQAPHFVSIDLNNIPVIPSFEPWNNQRDSAPRFDEKCSRARIGCSALPSPFDDVAVNKLSVSHCNEL